MTYTLEHAGALADIRAAGADVTFSRSTATYNPATDTFSGSGASTVTGAAMRVKGNPLVYAALSLVELGPVTLLFAPDTYGELPALGATVSWEGKTRTVKSVEPVAPDGNAVIARIIVV